MQSDFLKVEKLTKKFAAFTAVDDVSFRVNTGEAFALLGESGCGKTTLLRCIAGLEVASTGAISVDGRDFFRDKSLIPVHQRNVGLVFQDYAVFPHKSISENILFGVRDKKRHQETLEQMLSLFKLEDQRDKMPDQLSGGQLQRVAFARTLAASPSLMLLDEPFSNLDKQLGVQLRNELKEIFTERKLPSILVTHDQQEAFAYADRIAVMKGGKILQCDTPEELYLNPVSLDVAHFLGNCQFMLGEGHGLVATTAIGDVSLKNDFHGPVKILIRPENIELMANENGTFKILSSVFLGGIRELTVTDENIVLKIHVASFKSFEPGTRVSLSPSCSLPAFKS
jgi:iron(III) transport system ATP-binding protein